MYSIAGTSLAPGDLIAWLFVGLIAGFFASSVVRGRGYGCIGNILVGLVLLSQLFTYSGRLSFLGQCTYCLYRCLPFYGRLTTSFR